MDELLDLLDEQEEALAAAKNDPSPTTRRGPSDNMDELLDLMDDNSNVDNDDGNNEKIGAQSTPLSSTPIPRNRHPTAQVVTPPPSSAKRSKPPQQQPGRHATTTKSKGVSAGIDDKLGIRMVERKVSSVDLLDMISINPYYTPASLSAMSLAALSRLLIEPPNRIDAATVTGKMNIVTVGIVFSNSGTRISSKGGAFCILDIGNFVSGPCVSVMLFGDLYSQFVRTCVPGKVVAIVNPNLLPLRPGAGKTSISFTVNSSNQFHLVAKATDFAFCKGTTRAKGPDGKWTATGGRCKNHVDKRVCEYCEYHRKQQQRQQQSMGSSKSVAAMGGGSLQQLRAQGQMAVASSRFGAVGVRNHGQFASTAGNSNGSQQRAPTQTKKTLAEQKRNLVLQQRQKTAGGNRFLNGRSSVSSGVQNQQQQQQASSSNGSRLLNGTVPLQMKSKSLSSGSSSSNINPYAKRNAGVPSAPIQKPRPQPKTGIVGSAQLRGDGDWFQRASKPKAANSRSGSLARAAEKAKQRKRHLNTDGGGFDGTVQVPKPSQLFASRGGAPRGMFGNARPSHMLDRTKSATSIMESQAAIARMLQQAKDDPEHNQLRGKSKSKLERATTSAKDSFYASVGDIDLDKVRDTKSKFAREIEAEEYAKSRQKVVELEKLEGSKAATSQKRQSTEISKSFTVEYFCKTCCSHSMYPPKSCMNAKHNVVKRRKLAEQQSRETKRTKLHQTSAADGGLRLGAGNEWSRNLKDFHS